MKSFLEFLTIWGAALATILAILRVVEFRYGLGVVIRVETEFDRETEILSIRVMNYGKRRMRVRAVSVHFGNADGTRQLDTTAFDQPLSEGDEILVTFGRQRLVDAARALGLTASNNSLLALHIRVAGRGPVGRTLRLAEFEEPDAGNYAPYIAANVFLGLGPNPPHVSTGRSLR